MLCSDFLPPRTSVSLSDYPCLTVVPIACSFHYPGQNAEFTLDLCQHICLLVTKKKKSHFSKGPSADDYSLHFCVCFLCYYYWPLSLSLSVSPSLPLSIFPQCIVNKRAPLALIVRKVRCVLLLALAAIGPVTCHNPVLYAQHRDSLVYQTRPPGTFPSVQEIKGSQGP